MGLETVLTVLILLIGFYMAWNIGANDVSNAMGTSVGSGALTWRAAVILAAILEFCGAFFVGSHVSKTMEGGVIKIDLFLHDPLILVLGMCGALMGTALWLQIASFAKWPVSTTHAIVGAIMGFGVFVLGWKALQWEGLISILCSWIVSPILSATVSYTIFTFLQRKILFAMNPIEATRQFMPFLAFIVFSTFTLSLIFNGLRTLSLKLSFLDALTIALLVGGGAAVIAYSIMVYIWKKGNYPIPIRLIEAKEMNTDLESSMRRLLKEKKPFIQRAPEYYFVERVFSYLQIFTACYVAFAHGANDVSNAIGPIAAVIDVLHHHNDFKGQIPSWLLAWGGVGIVVGLATWGWRVIETVGKKITELTPTRGFCAEFGAATTILLASKIGLPISTTHCLVGALFGVGLARGIAALNLNVIRQIVFSWIMTIPASATMGIGCFYLLKIIFS